MSFLLDTNICSYHLRRPSGLAHRFVQHSGRLYVPTIVLAELYAGAYRRADPTPILTAVAELVRLEVQVLDFDMSCADQFGKLRASLASHGQVVPPIDLLIASVAMAHDLTLVTHNTQDFQHIPGIRLADWLPQSQDSAGPRSNPLLAMRTDPCVHGVHPAAMRAGHRGFGVEVRVGGALRRFVFAKQQGKHAPRYSQACDHGDQCEQEPKFRGGPWCGYGKHQDDCRGDEQRRARPFQPQIRQAEQGGDEDGSVEYRESPERFWTEQLPASNDVPPASGAPNRAPRQQAIAPLA